MPFSIATTVSSVIIVMAPAIVISLFIEEIISASSVMMVGPVISVMLFTAIMSIHYVGMRILTFRCDNGVSWRHWEVEDWLKA